MLHNSTPIFIMSFTTSLCKTCNFLYYYSGSKPSIEGNQPGRARPPSVNLQSQLYTLDARPQFGFVLILCRRFFPDCNVWAMFWETSFISWNPSKTSGMMGCGWYCPWNGRLLWCARTPSVYPQGLSLAPWTLHILLTWPVPEGTQLFQSLCCLSKRSCCTQWSWDPAHLQHKELAFSAVH